LANPELGAKQICPNCQSKFYDLGRRPAACPKCGTEFDPEEALKTRRVRARSSAPDYESEDEAPKVAATADPDGFEDEADETPEVDEAPAEPIEADEDAEDVVGATPAPSDDLGVDFAEDEELEEEADDVPFLEDEDEDDSFEDEIEVPNPDDE
jgi:uncharacterized protein (TIGR02300 family)